MIIPTTAVGVIVVVALVFPGIVYAAMRTTLQGYGADDRSVSRQIVHAVMVSAALDSIYLLAFGNALLDIAPVDGDGVTLERVDARGAGGAVLVFGVAIPAGLAYVAYSRAPLFRGIRIAVRHRIDSAGWLRRAVEAFAPQTGYVAAPTAWDWVLPQKGGTYVRVLTGPGRWVGGWFGDDAFFSSFPEPRDLYIPQQWALGTDGEFKNPIPNTRGVWLSLDDAQIIEWLAPDDVNIEEDAKR